MIPISDGLQVNSGSSSGEPSGVSGLQVPDTHNYICIRQPGIHPESTWSPPRTSIIYLMFIFIIYMYLKKKCSS